MGNSIFYFLFFLCLSPSFLAETLGKKRKISCKKSRLKKKIKFNKRKLRVYKKNLRKKRKMIQNKRLRRNYYNVISYSCNSNNHGHCEKKYQDLEKKCQELEKNLLSQGQQRQKEKEDIVKSFLEQQQKEKNNNQKNHDTYEKNYNHLREHLENLEKKCDHQHENLNKENNSLKKDHRFLHQKFEHLEEKYDDYNKENENLNENNQLLQNELHKTQKKNHNIFKDINICINQYDDLINREKEENNKSIKKPHEELDEEMDRQKNIEKEIEEIEKKIKENSKKSLFQEKEINIKEIMQKNIGLSDIKECYSEENYSNDFYTQEKKKNFKNSFKNNFFEDSEEEDLSQHHSFSKEDIVLYPLRLSEPKSPVCQTFSLKNSEEDFLLSPQQKTKIMEDNSFSEDDFAFDDDLFEIKQEIENITSKGHKNQSLVSKSIDIDDINIAEDLKKTELSVIDEENIDHKFSYSNNTENHLFDTKNIESQQVDSKGEESSFLLEQTRATQVSFPKKSKIHSKKEINKHKRCSSDMTQDKTSSFLQLIKEAEKDTCNKSYHSNKSPIRSLYEEARCYFKEEKEIEKYIPNFAKNYKAPPPSPKEQAISFEAKNMLNRLGYKDKTSNNMLVTKLFMDILKNLQKNNNLNEDIE